MFVRHVGILIFQLSFLRVHSLRSLHDAAMIPSRIRWCWQQTLFQAVLSITPLAVTSLPFPAHAVLPSPSVHSWQFENGSVTIPDPLLFGDRMLRQPRLLGSGGGGAVFALKQDNINDGNKQVYAVKTSWDASTESVVNECRVLQFLEQKHVTGVERCLGIQPYTNGDETGCRRVMILLEPVMDGPIAASLSELPPRLQSHAIERIMKVMLQILSANVAVTDVQMLISQETGDVLFIDLSEARVLSSSTGTVSFMEQALLSNFVQEVSALIPEDQVDFAANIVSEFLKEQKLAGVLFSEQTLALLQGQFLVDET